MAQLGADVEQLDRLARTFQSEASRLERSASVLRSLVASVTWMGPDAGRFRGQYNQAMAPQLAAVARALTHEARNLTRQPPNSARRAPTASASVPASAAVSAAVVEAGAGQLRRRWWIRLWRRGLHVHGCPSRRRRGVRRRRGARRVHRRLRRSVLDSRLGRGSGRCWRRGLGGLHDGRRADRGRSRGYAFAGLRGEVGQHTSVFGGLVENESTLSGLLGAEAEGNGSFHLGLDGL